MNWTGNIEKDFEKYLTESGLWERYRDNPLQWVYKLGEKMNYVTSLTFEEGMQMSENEMKWWILLVSLQNHYGNDYDLFGTYIEQVKLTSQSNGQFFTPMQICELMVRLTYDPEGEQKTVSDCASGSGRMMIAHACYHESKRPGSSSTYIYYNRDIDYKSFVFSTLNAILRNLHSVNIHGDTMTMERRKVIITRPSVIGWSYWYNENHRMVAQYFKKVA